MDLHVTSFSYGGPGSCSSLDEESGRSKRQIKFESVRFLKILLQLKFNSEKLQLKIITYDCALQSMTIETTTVTATRTIHRMIGFIEI